MQTPMDLARTFIETPAFTTTNDFLRVPRAILDVRHFPITSIAIRVANTGDTNDVSYKVRGSIDGRNWTDVVTLDGDGAEQAATGATVQEDTAAEVFITRDYDGGVPGSFAYYDVVAESTVDDTPSTVVVTMSAR